jgi:uncharacterized membrane protein
LSDQTFPAAETEPGRVSALLVYGLYILSIPSAAVFALIGVILAYIARDSAGPIARRHLNEQIRIWWVAFAWSLALLIIGAIGGILTIVLIGFPIIWLAGLAAFIVMIWFTIKSILGFIALLNQRAA